MKRILVIALGTIVLVLIAVFLMVPAIVNEDYEYAGSETFLSEEDCLSWKDVFTAEVVAREGKLTYYSLLASGSLILVSWEVRVPYTQVFSHGTTFDGPIFRWILLGFLTILLGLPCIVLPATMVSTGSKEK